MTDNHYRFTFGPSAALEDVEPSLLLALFAAEALHGAERVRLDVAFRLDRERRQLTVAADTAAGADLARILLGFLRREFADDTFTVARRHAVGAGAADCPQPAEVP